MLVALPGSALANGVTDVTPPMITITTPALNAVYSLNEVVLASYTCTDPESGILYCNGPVPSGSPIDTSTVGMKNFAVSSTNGALGINLATAPYQVVADYQPDARIRRIGRTNQLGNDIYNTTAVGQTLTATAVGPSFRRFVVSIENDGDLADAFTVAAPGFPTSGYSVKYFHRKTDITAAIEAGTYQTPPIAPGGVYRIRAVVEVTPPLGVSGISRFVTVTSDADGSTKDVVSFIVGEDFCLAAAC